MRHPLYPAIAISRASDETEQCVRIPEFPYSRNAPLAPQSTALACKQRIAVESPPFERRSHFLSFPRTWLAMPKSRKLGLLLLVFVALGLRLLVSSGCFGDRTQGPPHLRAWRDCGPSRRGRRILRSSSLAPEGLYTSQQRRRSIRSSWPAAYSIFGIASPAALLAVKLLQSVAGTALVLGVAWLGWSLIPDRRSIGWTAAWGAALYPTHVYMKSPAYECRASGRRLNSCFLPGRHRRSTSAGMVHGCAPVAAGLIAGLLPY